MNLKPLGDRVLVQIIEEEKTSGGVILPSHLNKEDRNSRKGLVLATGIGRMNDGGHFEPMEVKKGDKILFSKYSDSELEIDGIKYITMYQGDIFGILV